MINPTAVPAAAGAAVFLTVQRSATMRNSTLSWLPVLLLCLAIFLQSSFPSPDMGPSFPFKDKLLHVAAYGLLAFLFAHACQKTWPGRLSRLQLVLVSVGFAGLYGLSDDFHQSLVAARQAEAWDVVADLSRGVTGALLYLKWLAARDQAAGR